VSTARSLGQHRRALNLGQPSVRFTLCAVPCVALMGEGREWSITET
jgi:hypothetical protein